MDRYDEFISASSLKQQIQKQVRNDSLSLIA